MDIFAVLVTVVLGLVHKTSTFSPMANLFPGLSSLQQVQLHCGRNCLNLFQTAADADPVVPRVPKDWEQDSIYKKIQVDHPPLSKKSSEKINWKLLKKWRKNHYLIQNGSFGGKNSPIIEYWIVLSIMVFDFTWVWVDGWPGNVCLLIPHILPNLLTPLRSLGLHP